MKYLLLFVTIAVTSTSFSQTKFKYKNDRDNIGFLYLQAPEKPGTEELNSYTWQYLGIDHNPVYVYDQFHPVEFISKRLVSKNGDIHISMITNQLSQGAPQITNGQNSLSNQTQGLFTMKLPYTYSCQVTVKNSVNDEIILDTLINYEGFATYPTDFNITNTFTTKAALQQHYALATTKPDWTKNLNYILYMNAAQQGIKPLISNYVTNQRINYYLPFSTVKTKDILFDELDNSVDSIKKFIAPTKNGKSIQNFHTASVYDQIIKMIPVFEKFSDTSYCQYFTDKEDAEQYYWNMQANLFTLYAITQQYKKAINIYEKMAYKYMEETGEQNKEAEELKKSTKINSSFNNLKLMKIYERTPVSRSINSIQNIKGLMLFEMEHDLIFRNYYHYER